MTSTLQAPAPAPVQSPRHLSSLDGVRGVAILLVLAHNLEVLEVPTSALAHFAELVFNFGWVGVQLFFVLSGFLITRILLQTQASPNYYTSFFARRVLRIFPLYYAALAVLLLLLPALGIAMQLSPGEHASHAWLWFYLVNWVQPLDPGGNPVPHFWSLAVEEQFYLLWPFVVRRCSPLQVLRIGVAIAVAALAIRIGMHLSGAAEDAIYMFSFCRMDALAMGAAAAALTQMPDVWPRFVRVGAHRMLFGASVLFVVGCLAVHGLYPRTGLLGQTIGYTVLALVFTIVVLSAAVADEGTQSARSRGFRALLNWAPLRSLGKYSYGIYIIHKPLHDLIGKPWLASHGLAATTSLAITLAYMAAAVGACWLIEAVIYRGFEVHFLALKRYFAP